MGIISTSNFAKDLVPGVKTWFGQKYKEYPIEYLDIFEKANSIRAYEEEAGVTGFGLAAIKTEGNGIAYDDQEQGFISRYVHATYGLGFIITREMYEDGIAVTVSLRRANALAFSIRQAKEFIGANVLNRAFNSSYTMGTNSDGVELCSEVHPNNPVVLGQMNLIQLLILVNQLWNKHVLILLDLQLIVVLRLQLCLSN